jgi:hypothetical protein
MSRWPSCRAISANGGPRRSRAHALVPRARTWRARGRSPSRRIRGRGHPETDGAQARGVVRTWPNGIVRYNAICNRVMQCSHTHAGKVVPETAAARALKSIPSAMTGWRQEELECDRVPREAVASASCSGPGAQVVLPRRARPATWWSLTCSCSARLSALGGEWVMSLLPSIHDIRKILIPACVFAARSAAAQGAAPPMPEAEASPPVPSIHDTARALRRRGARGEDASGDQDLPDIVD